MQNRKDTAADWVDVKILTAEDSDLAVLIQELPLYRPKYSVKVGRLKGDKVVPFLPVYTEGQGKIAVKPVCTAVYDLLKKAEEFIHEKAQAREDEIIETKSQRERAQVDRNKPQTRHTGKTEKNRQKRKAA